MLYAARWLARPVWAAMLWFMRRPLIKAGRRASLRVLPLRMREAARRSISRQDRFALRNGLAILTGAFAFLLISVVVTAAYYFTIQLAEQTANSAFELRRM